VAVGRRRARWFAGGAAALPYWSRLASRWGYVLGKIAADVERALARRRAEGAPGGTTGRLLAAEDGWSAADVICTLGPADRPFEERHAEVSLAVVVAGTFQYRSSLGSALMTPGSLFLGDCGGSFECGHEHAAGDRCIAFRYRPEYFERLAAEAGLRRGSRGFRVPRVPPLRELAPLVSRAARGVLDPAGMSWEELAIELGAAAARVAAGYSAAASTPAGALERVTRSVRSIEHEPGAPWTLSALAAEAGQSPFHYLRTFKRLTGVTPHQFILRARLREAAVRLVRDEARVIDIALDSGFGDISNFNRAFRAEFGVSPERYRREGRRPCTAGYGAAGLARRGSGRRGPTRP
jgi:AraC family transcriptional regulator